MIRTYGPVHYPFSPPFVAYYRPGITPGLVSSSLIDPFECLDVPACLCTSPPPDELVEKFRSVKLCYNQRTLISGSQVPILLWGSRSLSSQICPPFLTLTAFHFPAR